MSDRAFRFGVVGEPDDAATDWIRDRPPGGGPRIFDRADARRAPAAVAVPSLAMAAAVADIRVGTFVAAAPLRTPRAAAWEAHTLTVLTDGRFEFGIGTGRPAVEAAGGRDRAAVRSAEGAA